MQEIKSIFDGNHIHRIPEYKKIVVITLKGKDNKDK
jgi:hypothetical protein